MWKCDSICCAQSFAILCVAAVTCDTSAVPPNYMSNHHVIDLLAQSDCAFRHDRFGTCISKLRDIYLPIYGDIRYDITQSLTFTRAHTQSAHERYKCHRIQNAASPRKNSFAPHNGPRYYMLRNYDVISVAHYQVTNHRMTT